MFHKICRFMGFLCCVCIVVCHIGVCFAAEEEKAEENGAVESVSDQESAEQDVDAKEKEEFKVYSAAMKNLRWDDAEVNEKRAAIYEKLSKLSARVTDLSQQAYEKAKANQQSLANRTLTAASVATMGIGAMQLAQGLSEKQADAAADKDMAAYMASMRCSYGDGQSVRMGPDSIELPTSDEIRAYRAEYLALAESLKFRKEALGLKPGIESEVIINKENTGLYDDQNTGITSGAYASRYRAAGGNEEDQKGLNADKKEAKTRMIAGGAVAGAGLVGSVIGNAVINKDSGKSTTEKDLADAKSEYESFIKEEIQKCNDKIQKHKDLAQQIKNDATAMQDARFQKYVKDVEATDFMPEDADINSFKGHKICY